MPVVNHKLDFEECEPEDFSRYITKYYDWNLTYPGAVLDKITTDRGYDKTNPPLNLLELDITPQKLISFFKDFSPVYMFTYLTFFEQLSILDNSKNDIKKNFFEKDY
jgi:hypothetical protein